MDEQAVEERSATLATKWVPGPVKSGRVYRFSISSRRKPFVDLLVTMNKTKSGGEVHTAGFSCECLDNFPSNVPGGFFQYRVRSGFVFQFNDENCLFFVWNAHEFYHERTSFISHDKLAVSEQFSTSAEDFSDRRVICSIFFAGHVELSYNNTIRKFVALQSSIELMVSPRA